MTPEEHDSIVGRFVEAIDYLKESKQIRGLQTFAEKYGIDKSSIYRTKERTFKAVWLIPLVRDYGINADWLLTGEGKMHG